MSIFIFYYVNKIKLVFKSTLLFKVKLLLLGQPQLVYLIVKNDLSSYVILHDKYNFTEIMDPVRIQGRLFHLLAFSSSFLYEKLRHPTIIIQLLYGHDILIMKSTSPPSDQTMHTSFWFFLTKRQSHTLYNRYFFLPGA